MHLLRVILFRSKKILKFDYVLTSFKVVTEDMRLAASD